jgi:mono/diheme cytochrome c family protein
MGTFWRPIRLSSAIRVPDRRAGSGISWTRSEIEEDNELEGHVKSVLTTVGCVAALVLCAGAASAQDAAKGAKVYTEQKCGTCHAIAGKGNAKGALDDVGSKLSAADIHQWIVDPVGSAAKAKATRKPVMTAKYGSLPKEDVDALVAYLASLKK